MAKDGAGRESKGSKKYQTRGMRNKKNMAMHARQRVTIWVPLKYTLGMMNRQEESWEKLDLELDHYMVDMKRYFNKLSNKSEQQRCTLWIKKLCECCGPDSGVLDRKNRNLYARLLLLMLQRGQLESPFTARPKPGPLERLPAYKSIYFDVPMHTGAAQQDRADLTDWEMGETDTRPKDLLAEFSSPLSPLSRYNSF
ncbi:CE112 protein, partial [Polypterus senegalus]